MYKSNILIITTGGGITGDVDNEGLVTYVNQHKGEQFLKKYILQNIPEVSNIANIDVLELTNVHSSVLTPDDWISFAKLIHKDMKKYDGFIITHGTDTLPYTAAAFSFFFQNPPVPIVFVASCVPLHFRSSPAREDLFDAIKVISWGNIHEVMVVNNGNLFQASRVINTQEYGKEIFTSKANSILGYVKDSKVFSNDNKKAITKTKKFSFEPKLEKKVFAQLIYPGYPPGILNHGLSNGEKKIIKGLVLISYGSGCFPLEGTGSLRSEVESLIKQKVAVVACSSSVSGECWLSKNEPYKKLLDVGIISSLDMTYHTTIVKLMWVLGQSSNLKEIKDMMYTPYCGEITRNYYLLP